MEGYRNSGNYSHFSNMTSELLVVQTKRHIFLSHFLLLAFTPSLKGCPPVGCSPVITLTRWLQLLGVLGRERSQTPPGVSQASVLQLAMSAITVLKLINLTHSCLCACLRYRAKDDETFLDRWTNPWQSGFQSTADLQGLKKYLWN